MDNKAYKAKRLQAFDGVKLTDNTYNLVIGLVLLWGIVINIIMASTMMEAITSLNPIVILLVYLVGSIGCAVVIYRSANPAVSFLGFTGLAIAMGLILTYVVAQYAKTDVAVAFKITAIVTAIMILASTLKPQFFLSIGRGLFIALLASIVVDVVGTLLLRQRMGMMDYIIALIFCGLIGFDWAKAQVYPKTLDNAVDSAADIYVDVVNLFIRVLSIVGNKND